MKFNEDKLKKIIIDGSRYSGESFEIKEETNLLYDLGYDSLSIVELMVDIETEFGACLDDESLSDILVYKDLKEKIQNRL